MRRRLQLGLPTVLGLGPYGYFIPYRYAARQSAAGPAQYPAVERVLESRADAFAETLRHLADCRPAFEAIRDGAAAGPDGAEAGDPSTPRWEQDWFPRLDAAVAYAMVRRFRPRRIVEVGAGHSTRFFARAVRDEGLATTHTVIDPAPRAALTGLPITFQRTVVTDAGTAPFDGLGAGDILFVDSSHVLMPGSDVDFLLNHVVPTLPAGTLLHVHDIFLPDGYPGEWAWRGYNEQLGVAGLMTSGAWRPLFASRYVATRMADAVAASAVADLPLLPGSFESSLWLRAGA